MVQASGQDVADCLLWGEDPEADPKLSGENIYSIFWLVCKHLEIALEELVELAVCYF